MDGISGGDTAREGRVGGREVDLVLGRGVLYCF